MADRKKKKVYGKDDRLAQVVQLFPAKPNKLFPDWLTELIQFMRFTEAVPCAHCGKKSKHHWTCLAAFRATNFSAFSAVASTTILAPLTPICRDHPFSPEIITKKKS